MGASCLWCLAHSPHDVPVTVLCRCKRSAAHLACERSHLEMSLDMGLHVGQSVELSGACQALMLQVHSCGLLVHHFHCVPLLFWYRDGVFRFCQKLLATGLNLRNRRFFIRVFSLLFRALWSVYRVLRHERGSVVVLWGVFKGCRDVIRQQFSVLTCKVLCVEVGKLPLIWECLVCVDSEPLDQKLLGLSIQRHRRRNETL